MAQEVAAAQEADQGRERELVLGLELRPCRRFLMDVTEEYAETPAARQSIAGNKLKSG